MARMTRVSVRTLHHYDAIGLLVPKRRNQSGYRLYDDDDLLRLQQILVARELDLSLETIRQSLDDPSFDHRAALLSQRRELLNRTERAQAMIRGIDLALAVLDGGRGEEEETMDMKALFDGFDPAQYDDKAENRWGNTDAYRECMRRTQSYTADDWKRLAAEQSAIYRDAMVIMQAGLTADDPSTLEIAERHRALVDHWFYPCDHAMHRGLADLYENDARFSANIDKHGEGLTAFLAAAIRENAEQHRK